MTCETKEENQSLKNIFMTKRVTLTFDIEEGIRETSVISHILATKGIINPTLLFNGKTKDGKNESVEVPVSPVPENRQIPLDI